VENGETSVVNKVRTALIVPSAVTSSMVHHKRRISTFCVNERSMGANPSLTASERGRKEWHRRRPTRRKLEWD